MSDSPTYPNIFMQWHGDGPAQFPLPNSDVVTWAENRINKSDVEYVPLAALTAARAQLASIGHKLDSALEQNEALLKREQMAHDQRDEAQAQVAALTAERERHMDKLREAAGWLERSSEAYDNGCMMIRNLVTAPVPVSDQPAAGSFENYETRSQH